MPERPAIRRGAGALPAVRQERMLDLLQQRGQATVTELVQPPA